MLLMWSNEGVESAAVATWRAVPMTDCIEPLFRDSGVMDVTATIESHGENVRSFK